MIDGNNSAFPHENGYDFKGERVVTAAEGLTKRELFAAMAMQGFVSYGYDSNQYSMEFVTNRAVRMADSLINQLNELQK